MYSKKYLLLLVLALFVGGMTTLAKPPHGGWKGENPCQGFFEGPFVGYHGQVPGSEGKLCYWQDNRSTLHAKVEIGGVPENEQWCIYLADGDVVEDLLHNSTAMPKLIGADFDLDDEVFFDEHICMGGCGSEGLNGTWAQPAFWVARLQDAGDCVNLFNVTPTFVTGFQLPGESFDNSTSTL